MKLALLIGALCSAIVAAGVYAAYSSHDIWPIAAAGLIVVVLFSVFDVWGRLDSEFEQHQGNTRG